MKNLKNKSLGVMLFLLVSTHNLILNAMDSGSTSIIRTLLIAALLKTAAATPPVKSPVSQIHQGCLNPLAEKGGPKCYIFTRSIKGGDCFPFIPGTYECQGKDGDSFLVAKIQDAQIGSVFRQTSVDPCGAPFRVYRDKLAGEKIKPSGREIKSDGRITSHR